MSKLGGWRNLNLEGLWIPAQVTPSVCLPVMLGKQPDGLCAFVNVFFPGPGSPQKPALPAVQRQVLGGDDGAPHRALQGRGEGQASAAWDQARARCTCPQGSEGLLCRGRRRGERTSEPCSPFCLVVNACSAFCACRAEQLSRLWGPQPHTSGLSGLAWASWSFCTVSSSRVGLVIFTLPSPGGPPPGPAECIVSLGWSFQTLGLLFPGLLGAHLRTSPSPHSPHLHLEGGPAWPRVRLEGNGVMGSGIQPNVPGDRPAGTFPRPPPLHPRAAGSNEVATNRSGGFVGTWLSFFRDRMSCWEQPLCLSFLSPFRLVLSWPYALLCPSSLLTGRALTQRFLGSSTVCSGVPGQETEARGPTGMRWVSTTYPMRPWGN